MKHKKHIIYGSIFAVVLIASAVTLNYAANAALSFIKDSHHNIVGLGVVVEDYSINLFPPSVKLEGIKIYPAGKISKRHLLGSVEEIKVSFSPMHLITKTFYARNLTLKNPDIKIVQYGGNRFNWSSLNVSESKEKTQDWEVWIEKVRVKNGVFEFRDRTRGHRIKLTDVDLKVSNIESGVPAEKLPTKLKLNAKIDNTKGEVFVKGKLNLFAEGINFKLKSSIKDAPVTYFRSFYAGQIPFSIKSGSLSMSSDSTSKKSMLNSNHHVTLWDLKAGGLHGALLNSFFLAKNSPVEVDVTVGGNLEKGNLHVGSQLSNGIGKMLVSRANEETPLGTPGRAIKSIGKSIGGGMNKLFGRDKKR